MKTALTPTLEIAYEENGPVEGPPVVLLHGFPDDVRAYDGVAPPLAAAGWRVLEPYLRGYGPTRFLDPRTPRSGQQAALGRDLLDFLDALGIERAALGGYDWGGRAACIVAALWPERVSSLVSIGGYNIQNIAARANRLCPIANTGCGTSGISTASAAAPGSRQTGDPSAGCCGNYGRRTGGSMTRPSSGPRYPSTIPISSRS
jgi:pimeloyl-ACP methyl ester carboxylesterase